MKNLIMQNKYILRCDMDGVLVGFRQKVLEIFPGFQEYAIEPDTKAYKKMDGKMWAAISRYQKEGKEFWYDCPPMDDCFELWNYIKQFDHGILTATGQAYFNAAPQKVKWAAKYFGPEVPIICVEKSVQKALYATPNTILIDDKKKCIDPWVAAGGIGILHTSAKTTIEELKKIMGN